MRPPDPVSVVHLFPEERAQLLDLLTDLSDEQWARPTACPQWSVKDLALHLLADDLGLLSRMRDRFSPTSPRQDESLVDFINRLNELWVVAARRLSPRVLCDLLRVTGDWTLAYLTSRDLSALGEPVSWAGPDPAPVWLDVAREYTERWHHQQHIRDALGASGLTDRRFFAPVLATFVHALPYTFRDIDAPQGTAVHLHLAGEAGGDWSVVREANKWSLCVGAPARSDARVMVDQAVAWRLFTKGLLPADAAQQAEIEGDPRLGRQVLETVAIIA
jgi:uncharacterized protein (TIGR03083 family)